ncbi:MAG: fumarylacetoacetase [Alphaproteobacteria bacterium]|nr:fumarylacetoacetase [Alphaproteobacteria bacterium]MBV8547926.1 fumarylacetoacetase [Alphaproteobacteria bacterium]
MKPTLDETHQPDTQSWVLTANAEEVDFPIQNLPFGVFRTAQNNGPHLGVAIGDVIVDLHQLRRQTLPEITNAPTEARPALDACQDATLNRLMALGTEPRRALRHLLHKLLRRDASPEIQQALTTCLVPQNDAMMLLPAHVGDYTDFYASLYHATHVGRLFRPDNPLLPNYKHIPIGYHGRASTLVVSGTPVKRPMGQTRKEEQPPTFGPTATLDYELELGLFVGRGNAMGQTIPVDRAEDHMFGVCIVNDWSARDVQAWEYQPLGPFLAKNFATSLSPWVVTMEALAPYRTQAFTRDAADPQPLPYLLSADDQAHGGIDLRLEVQLLTPRMQADGQAAYTLSRGNFDTMYWTFAQMLAHHASNGCSMQAGDLLASGTISGPTDTSRGCLLEITSRGKNPVHLPNGEERKFLQDGDTLVMRGLCKKDGYRTIGLGTCTGTIINA